MKRSPADPDPTLACVSQFRVSGLGFGLGVWATRCEHVPVLALPLGDEARQKVAGGARDCEWDLTWWQTGGLLPVALLIGF